MQSLAPPKDESTKWKWMTLLFGVLSLCLLATLIGLCVTNKKHTRSPNYEQHTYHTTESKQPQVRHVPEFLVQHTDNVFSQLSADEISLVIDFLRRRTDLDLVEPDEAMVNSNVIHLIQTKIPEKYSVLRYLEEGGPRPERRATVVIFKGAANPPVVEEYIVGPLPDILYAKLLNSSSKTSTVPFVLRPLSKIEFKNVHRHLITKVARIADTILRESYGATPFDCGDRCLKSSMAPVSEIYLPKGRRKIWYWFQYDVEHASLNPVDFQFLVDLTSVHHQEWRVEKVWYSNQMFDSLDELLVQYHAGTINKTRLSFPSEQDTKDTGLAFRFPLVPEQPRRAPRQFEPDGPRYNVHGNEVTFLNWDFNFYVSPTDGLQFFNIRFAKERILYELSMQEVVVTYSGNNPATRHMHFADGAGLYGTRYRGLVPGSDCPIHATMINTYVYSLNDKGKRILENALCIYEHNTHVPLRRHRSYGMAGASYSGLEATALVVRGIVSFINYDYAFDHMFYQNGAIETKVSMTGYLGATFYYPEEEQYGAHVRKTVSAGLHNHLFHFKVDIDVKGTSNRYETLDIKTRTETDPWDKTSQYTQPYFERNLKNTELSAVYKYNFDTPKNLLFTQNNSRTSEDVPRSYRILPERMSKQLLQEGHGFERSIPWSRYQMAVTKYREGEERSSSIFAMWDARKPVVNFQSFLDNDDNIVDEVRISARCYGSFAV